MFLNNILYWYSYLKVRYMAKNSLRNQALEMRKQGSSYSQIKQKLKVSKSSLSLWLRHMPLPESQIRTLRDHSAKRIEHFRETMKRKRVTRLQSVYHKVSKEVGVISKRDLFIAGLFLYWGEGTKADPYMVMFTNTDPAMIKFFIHWIQLFGISKNELKIYLHLYSDMNINKAIQFWSNELDIPLSAFRKPYIKQTISKKQKNYKGRFGFGTCNIYVSKRDTREKIGMGIARLRELYSGVAFDPLKAI